MPRNIGLDASVVERCRVRQVRAARNSPSLTLVVSMTFREAVRSREVIWVEVAPNGGWHPRHDACGLHVLNSVPHDTVMLAQASAD